MSHKMGASDVSKIAESLSLSNEALKEIDMVEELDVEGDVDQGTETHPAGTVDDLGDESECGEPEKWDMVDSALDGLVQMLVDNDYPEGDAEEAVFDALSYLIDDESVEDTPDVDKDEGIKSAWVNNAVPKIKAKLKEMGLEFNG